MSKIYLGHFYVFTFSFGCWHFLDTSYNVYCPAIFTYMWLVCASLFDREQSSASRQNNNRSRAVEIPTGNLIQNSTNQHTWIQFLLTREQENCVIIMKDVSNILCISVSVCIHIICECKRKTKKGGGYISGEEHIRCLLVGCFFCLSMRSY